jgi:alkanesulfonate monooxygenase SsuD/methylene tetrahydromethanopterin reductase-like flavin-dependent oxidoreductase (luciferase family)
MNNKHQFGLFLGYGSDFTYPRYQTIIQEAERLGYDALWCQDNITGHHPVPRDFEIFDTWTFLTAMACDTKKIRLGSMATPALRRFAPLLAKTIASLDVISKGRINVGLGSGDDKFQYEMIGQEFPEKGNDRRQILRESIEVMKLLWTQDHVNYQGNYFTLKDAVVSPKPVQKPIPPFYIAISNSRRTMPRLAAETGSGIGVMWGHDPSVKVTVDAFQEEWQACGRAPEDYVALRSSFIIFTNEKDDEKAHRYESSITPFPYGVRQTASPAKVPEGSYADMYIIGSPSHVVEEIKRRVIDMGFNQFMCTFVVCPDIKVDTNGFPGWAGSYLGGLRLFADQVLPELRKI